MALEFKVFTRNEDSALTDLGTVKAIAGKGGKIAFIRRNFNDPKKRIALLITNKKGESAVVACSEQVTKGIREGKLKLAQLLGLSIIENEEGRNFVSMPATGAIQSFEVDSIKVAEMETEEAAFVPAELIAF